MLLANGADPDYSLDYVKDWWALEDEEKDIKERFFLLVLMLEGKKIEAGAWEHPSEVVAEAMEEMFGDNLHNDM